MPRYRAFLLSALVALGVTFGAASANAANLTLLNVSYDPTREFYNDFNAAFNRYWPARSRDTRLSRTSALTVRGA